MQRMMPFIRLLGDTVPEPGQCLFGEGDRESRLHLSSCIRKNKYPTCHLWHKPCCALGETANIILQGHLYNPARSSALGLLPPDKGYWEGREGLLTFADGDLVAPRPVLQALDLEGVALHIILRRREEGKTSSPQPRDHPTSYSRDSLSGMAVDRPKGRLSAESRATSWMIPTCWVLPGGHHSKY